MNDLQLVFAFDFAILIGGLAALTINQIRIDRRSRITKARLDYLRTKHGE